LDFLKLFSCELKNTYLCDKYEIMKRFILILAISFFAVSTALSTDQISDILIIGNERVYLESFPLENLRKDNNLEKPFDSQMFKTSCWRGYFATWEIIEGYLVLKEVQSAISKKTKLNIAEYLKNNGYNPKIINGFVAADWFSGILKLESYARHCNEIKKDRFCAEIITDQTIELIFDNGKLIKNNIIPIEDYKIGDSLSLSVYDDEIGFKQIKGIIRENNGRKVRLEILPYRTDKEQIKAINSNNFWINPRYCKRKE